MEQPDFVALAQRKLMFEFHAPSRRDTLLSKLSSLAGRVASAF
jgi:hypothetical protein